MYLYLCVSISLRLALFNVAVGGHVASGYVMLVSWLFSIHLSLVHVFSKFFVLFCVSLFIFWK